MGLIEFNVTIITKKISPNRRVSCIFGLYIWFKWTITAGNSCAYIWTRSLKETNRILFYTLLYELNSIEITSN